MHIDNELLKLVKRIAVALETIAKNTEPEKIDESDYSVRGFKVGGTD